MTNSLSRLDKLLVDRGLAPSRESAKNLIESGAVTVSGIARNKPESMFPSNADVNLVALGDEVRWVSRGALKLIKGLDEWGINPDGWSCIDVGASTGGFTQVLLSRGASRVAAVDVGYGQLAWVLRNDPRVLPMERTNARYLKASDVGWTADLVTVDASFISLRLLLPNLCGLLSKGGGIIALVKPQFEVGRERVGKGVVRDPELHAEVLRDIASFALGNAALSLHGATYSPIRGPEGNIEFIFLLRAGQGPSIEINLDLLVREAHEKI
jgi:23S rRNA (cytidine1920-2'-O)/16S rRNA (cytidine1409-2'-O)-methyltransferase